MIMYLGGQIDLSFLEGMAKKEFNDETQRSTGVANFHDAQLAENGGDGSESEVAAGLKNDGPAATGLPYIAKSYKNQ